MRRLDIESVELAAYEEYAHLAPAVRELRAEAAQVGPLLGDRTLWMVNSTAQGGGVAEMLPTMVGLLRELGIPTEWAVLETERSEFFALTKRIHNLIHGEGDPHFDEADRELFETVNRENAARLAEMMRPGDLLAVHDPQPLPLPCFLPPELEILPFWRCHIGVDERNAQTDAVWEFLRPYREPYLQAVFSAPEYIPDDFARRARVVYPAVDPLTHKNRTLSVHKIAGVLTNSALAVNPGPVLTPSYPHVAERLLPSGEFAPANMVEDIGLLHRPIVTQVSRWDRLKGFAPLMDAFVRLKHRLHDLGATGEMDPLDRRRLELVRLVLAGPEPASVSDDPEGVEVIEELKARYVALDPLVQRDVALIALPMTSREENALMINALQRTSSIIVQNSIREGFGLTITEAMWKGVPVLSNSYAVGPRQQVRDGLDGRLTGDPCDVEELARVLDEMLAAPRERDAWGRSAQRHAHEKFLIFSQLGHWLRVLSDLVRVRTSA